MNHTLCFKIRAESGDLNSIAQVQVKVLDVNDHSPIFSDFSLVFNNFPGQFAMRPGAGRRATVPAFDPDVNDTLRFWFDPQDEPTIGNLLQLDQKTGEIRLGPNLNTNRQIDTFATVCVSGTSDIFQI